MAALCIAEAGFEAPSPVDSIAAVDRRNDLLRGMQMLSAIASCYPVPLYGFAIAHGLANWVSIDPTLISSHPQDASPNLMQKIVNVLHMKNSEEHRETIVGILSGSLIYNGQDGIFHPLTPVFRSSLSPFLPLKKYGLHMKMERSTWPLSASGLVEAIQEVEPHLSLTQFREMMEKIRPRIKKLAEKATPEDLRKECAELSARNDKTSRYLHEILISPMSSPDIETTNKPVRRLLPRPIFPAPSPSVGEVSKGPKA